MSNSSTIFTASIGRLISRMAADRGFHSNPRAALPTPVPGLTVPGTHANRPGDRGMGTLGDPRMALGARFHAPACAAHPSRGLLDGVAAASTPGAPG